MKIDVFLRLRKDTQTGIVTAYQGNSLGFPPDSAGSERFVYSVIKFQVDVDDTIFDPVVDTGLTITATRNPIDSEAVVRGLRRVQSEVRDLEAG
jgi:hypothetical protein